MRFKLGVLGFESDQYLGGIETARPEQPLLLAPEVVVEHTRSLAAERTVSRLYTVLASALARQNQKEEARDLLKSARQLDPSNPFARRQLNRMR